MKLNLLWRSADDGEKEHMFMAAIASQMIHAFNAANITEGELAKNDGPSSQRCCTQMWLFVARRAP